jgi:hypothetical protein
MPLASSDLLVVESKLGLVGALDDIHAAAAYSLLGSAYELSFMLRNTTQPSNLL